MIPEAGHSGGKSEPRRWPDCYRPGRQLEGVPTPFAEPGLVVVIAMAGGTDHSLSPVAYSWAAL